jgi:LysM repeat protein
MQMKKGILALFSVLVVQLITAQDEAVIREYITRYKDIAISEMQRTGVPASIKLAQGIHETFAGQSDLVLKSNNHFGIKCKTEWKGESVKHTDDAPNECFRKYSSAADSYRDHSNYLKGNERYASLFKLPPTDYSGWAYGLKKAGYATNPRYAPVIIKLIEEYHLQEYSFIAMGKKAESGLDVAEISNPKTEEIKPVVNEVIPEQAVIVKEDLPAPVYPTGEFKINETRVAFIAKGTSYLAIAEQYNVPLARIFEFNDMKQAEALEKDQLIYLQRKRKTGNNEVHIVKPGESLHDIAQEEALRIESVLEYNHLSWNEKPAAGEKLYLKTNAPGPPMLEFPVNPMLIKKNKPLVENRSASDDSKNNFVSHTVGPKETIYSIAGRYKVKIEDIVKWNNLRGYDLKTGQQLKIQKM